MDSGCVVDLGMLTEFDTQLRNMVDNLEFSNVTFVCEDGIRVHAVRQLLAGRSPYFKHLLVGEMTESRSSSVELPTVSSSVLILVLKFLYTGKLIPGDFGGSLTSRVLPCALGDERVRSDWNLVVKAVAAARFFMLDHLEKVLVDRLQDDVTQEKFLGEEESLTQFVKRFSILHEYPTLWAAGVEGNPFEALTGSMAEALRNHELIPATLSGFSEAAFCNYLQKAKEPVGDVGWFATSPFRALVLDDYLRLRQILTWCTGTNEGGALQVLEGVPLEDLDRTCLPGPEIAIDLIDKVEDDSSCTEFDFSRGRASFMSKIAKGPLKHLLNYVDLTCIPPGLLCNVIEPLEILEPVELAKILRTQVMRNSRWIREDLDAPLPHLWRIMGQSTKDIWRLPVETDNVCKFTVRRETNSLAVCAVAGLLMNTSKQLDWDIRVTPRGSLEQQSMANFEFGFIALDCADTFAALSGPLSADSRCLAIQLGRDLKTVVGFCNGRETRRWTLGADDQFGWGKSVMMSVKEEVSKTSKPNSKISYLAGSRKFSFVAAKEKLIYPAVYFPLGMFGQLRFRPHYDQLSVDITNTEGCSDLVVVKFGVKTLGVATFGPA
ncbi:hypothetical protein R1sor_015644 [Riccia sorocarpa]|uniref:BTB domain-containing protein n=1 Tax=Riccia sorocarpa TaxID=122646 RepID=A0ABD3HG58_9MARC